MDYMKFGINKNRLKSIYFSNKRLFILSAILVLSITVAAINYSFFNLGERKLPDYCPKCKSTQFVEIQYGYPNFNSELKEKIQEKKIYLGGCVITSASPRWHCFKCDNNWGKLPRNH